MGAKQKITQAPTMTPEQLALLNSMMRGVTNQMQGIDLGGIWGGLGTSGRQSIGGKPWNPGVSGVSPVSQAIAQAGMKTVPSSGGTAPVNPALLPDPFGLAAYSNRDQLVNPIVNPFRRNLGG